MKRPFKWCFTSEQCFTFWASGALPMPDRKAEVIGLMPIEVTTGLHVKFSFSHTGSVCSYQGCGICLGDMTTGGVLVAANSG